jgi:hypothetical protein
MSVSHPYEKYQNLKVWKVISKGIADLEANGDIEQKTATVYIVGYLSKLLSDKGLIDVGESRTDTKSSIRGRVCKIPGQGTVRAIARVQSAAAPKTLPRKKIEKS